MNSADQKRLMKTFRLLTPEEQRILLEMVGAARGKKAMAGEDVLEQRVKALREWNRLSRRGVAR